MAERPKCHICNAPAEMDDYMGTEPSCCVICMEPCCEKHIEHDASWEGDETGYVDESVCTKCIDNPDWSMT